MGLLSVARLPTLAGRLATVKTQRLEVTTGSWRTGKGSSTKRGYGYKWQQARLVFLNANPLCVFCDREGRTTAATVVDHITPHKGDMTLFWDRANWQPLCASCHSSVKQRVEAC